MIIMKTVKITLITTIVKINIIDGKLVVTGRPGTALGSTQNETHDVIVTRITGK